MIPSTHRQRIPTLLPRRPRPMRHNRQRMLRRGLAGEGGVGAEDVAVVVAEERAVVAAGDEAARTVGMYGLSATSQPHAAAAAGPATAAGGAGATKGSRQG